MPAHSFNRLEDVHFAVLYHLLYAGVRRAINSAAASTVRRNHSDRPVIRPLSPPLHHIHQLHQAVGRRWNLVAHRPASKLEQLNCLRGRLHTSHHLGQRHDLLVYPEDLQ